MMSSDWKPLHYLLCICGTVYGTQQSASALRFAQTLLSAGHILTGIFFYGEGVHNANALTAPATDELALVKEWQKLACDYSVPLYVCVAAALRRGVVMDTAERVGNVATGFQITGLTTLTELALKSDRTLQF